MSRYGMTIPYDDLPLADQRDALVELVDLGYTDVWTLEVDGTDAFTPLVLASVWAPELLLGTAIVPVFTRGPATLAQSIASLASAAPGRVQVGIGASSEVIVTQWNGLAFTEPYKRVRDTVRFLRTALAGEKVTMDYETFSVRGFRLSTPPPAQPAILIAALRAGMLRLAGQEGDGTILNWLAASDVPTVVRHIGADTAASEVVARIFVAPTEDAEEARAIGRRAIATYLNVPVYAAFHTWLGRDELLKPMWEAWQAGDRKAALTSVPDAVVDDLVVHGSPEACREHLIRYAEAGVTCPVIALLPTGRDPRVVARELAPR